MDVSQANKLQNAGTDIVINENIADTKKRFDSMISNPKMTTLLTSMGISPDDYAALIRSGSGTEKRLIMSSIQSGVL